MMLRFYGNVFYCEYNVSMIVTVCCVYSLICKMYALLFSEFFLLYSDLVEHISVNFTFKNHHHHQYF